MSSHNLARVILSAGILVMGCSSAPEQAADQSSAPAARIQPARSTPPPAPPEPTLSQIEILYRLKSAGLELERREKTIVYPSDYEKFPVEPRTMFTVRVSDGKGNATNMTLVEFGNVREAAAIRGVNGFRVHNWFFLGTINNYFRDRVTDAIG